MGNRCSIQQNEEINCWLEQSPENGLYRPPGGGGGGTSVIEGDRGRAAGQGYDFAGHQYRHRVSNRPNVVIAIGTGYQIGLMWSSPLAQGIKIDLLGYGGLLRLSQGPIPIV